MAETAHGLRLLDRFEELESSKFEEVTERIIENIVTIMDKLNTAAGPAVLVGIVDIHRVQLSARHHLLERALPVLLSVRLSREPEIIMLEREDLKLLLDEKWLTNGKDSEFWRSAVLIDGYLQPKNGGVELMLHLRQAENRDIATFNVAVTPNEPSSAIDRAAAEIINRLRHSPPSGQLHLDRFYPGERLKNKT